MFIKSSLYDTKKATLESAIALINARAKALRKLLTWAKIEIQKIREEKPSQIEDFLSQEREQVDNIASLIQHHIQVYLQHLLDDKKKVLSAEFSLWGLTDPFEPSSIISIHKESKLTSIVPQTFFSSSAYTSITNVNNAFNNAAKEERDLLQFRVNVVDALMVAAFFIINLSLCISAALLIALGNPIVGFAFSGLLVGACIYDACSISS